MDEKKRRMDEEERGWVEGRRITEGDDRVTET